MSRKTAIIFFITFMLFLVPLVVFASVNGLHKGEYPIVKVAVDEKTIDFDVPAFIMDGRTLVPARFVSEALGGEVIWDQATYTVKINSIDSAKLISDRCIQCHGITYIENKKPQAKEWPAIVQRMENKKSRLLNSNEYETLIKYLSDNYSTK